ncbi:MAG: SGNH/GDSL hydrolase family protein [Candidatus Thorarchaeota archaeon]
MSQFQVRMIGGLILGLVISVLALVGFMFLYTFVQMSKLPDNTPIEFLKSDQITSRKRVVLIGDSITHGRIGSNYIELLSQWDKDNEFDFINAGINGDLVWNVCQRLDEIVECRPDVITILIGTNDANASLSPESQHRYAKRNKLPTLPTHDWFRTMFTELLTELTQRTDSRVAVLSLPTIGEELGSIGFEQSQKYSETIKKIAMNMNIDYLHLNELMVEGNQSVPSETEFASRESELEMFKATIRYYLLHKDWDSISERNGFRFHIDYLHLNTEGARLIAELIQGFLDNNHRLEDTI